MTDSPLHFLMGIMMGLSFILTSAVLILAILWVGSWIVLIVRQTIVAYYMSRPAKSLHPIIMRAEDTPQETEGRHGTG